MKVIEFANKTKEEIFQILQSREEGLTEKETEDLRQIVGLNEIKAKETTWRDILLRQFHSFFFYLLFLAGLISFAVGEKINSLLIFVLAFINVFLGFIQEYRANKVLKLLKEYLPQKAKVLRNGQEKVIEAKFLVPGDIILLESEDMVPADLRLLEVNNFVVDESILTGESLPQEKTSEPIENVKDLFKAQNIAFSGTSVISGLAKGIVINTGKNTEFGKITKLAAPSSKPSLYEKEIAGFSKVIFKTVFFTICLIFILNFIIKKQTNLIDFSIFCLALIVSLVPEALSVVVGSSLSQAALKLAKKKVVVKRLSAIGDLGNIEILCADKTGTLTENKLKLETVIAPDKKRLMLYFLLVSPLFKKEKSHNPLDNAVLKIFSLKRLERCLQKIKLLYSIPFDFKRLRSSVLFENGKGEKMLIIRGTADSVLEICSSFEIGNSQENLLKEIKGIESQQGQRVIALASKPFFKNQYTSEDEKDLTFLGYLTFSDPLKKTAYSAIQSAKKLKLKIKIISGDSKEVTGKIASEVKLISHPDEVILGKELENLNEEEFLKKCEEFNAFSRVSPELKLKIIKALKKKYEVAFLGEGINDVPALKTANVGLAVKEATDVSKESADIVLLDKDLKVIVDGIKEGRISFANLNKYLKTALSSNFGNFYSIALMSLILPFLPMLPTQILLENVLSDLPLIAISNDTVDLEELKRPKMYSLSKIFPYILILALISSLFDFLFVGLFYRKAPTDLFRTLWFVMSLLTEIILIFIIRSRKFFLKASKPSKILLLSSILVSLFTILLPFTKFGQTLFSFTMPNIISLIIIFFLVLVYLLSNELAKKLYFKHQ